MATARPNIDELFECPVCFESYTDPRSLSCAHQFCLKCLEPIVKRHPSAQDKITCPTCRHDTHIKPGEKARDLPRPVLMNEVQGLLGNLMGPSKKSAKKNCDLCETLDMVATNYCYQCQAKMCDSCLSDHDKYDMFVGHKSVNISDYLFCLNHGNIVTTFCHKCKCGICPKCAAKDHREHNTEGIHVVAGQSRIRVKEFIKTHQSNIKNKTVFANIKTKVRDLKQSQDNIVTQINRILDSLKSLESKLEHTRNEVLAKTSADIKTLKLYEADLGDLDTSRTRLIGLGQYLIEKASDPELVLKAMELPTASIIRDTIQPPTIKRFAENKLSRLETYISKWIHSCNVNCEGDSLAGGIFEIYNEPSIEKNETLTLKQNVNTSDTHCVLFNTQLSKLAVRSKDKDAPIKVYNLSGLLVNGIGKKIKGLDGDGLLYIDHRRSLYLAPCEDHLTTIDIEGKVHKVIQVKGSNLNGVAYCDISDQYIVTDTNKHRVVIIDAKSRKVVNSFGSLGHRDCQFHYPFDVCVGDIRGRTTMVVSDYYNHSVKLFELTGRHVKTYGIKGSEDGQLRGPQGVAVDSASRVIVCDSMNQRVVAFWEDGNTDHWESLLSGEELGGRPTAIDIDPANKLVVVCPFMTDIVQLYSYE